MKIFWFLPTHGDSRYLGTTEGARPVDLSYLRQVAQAADSLGYEGVLIPDHTPAMSCAAPWHAGMAFALGYMKAAITIIEA